MGKWRELLSKAGQRAWEKARTRWQFPIPSLLCTEATPEAQRRFCKPLRAPENKTKRLRREKSPLSHMPERLAQCYNKTQFPNKKLHHDNLNPTQPLPTGRSRMGPCCFSILHQLQASPLRLAALRSPISMTATQAVRYIRRDVEGIRGRAAL